MSTPVQTGDLPLKDEKRRENSASDVTQAKPANDSSTIKAHPDPTTTSTVSSGQTAGRSTTATDASPTPPRYHQQFSASTQMIMSRIKSGKGSNSSLSSTPSNFSVAQPPTPANTSYEDVKRRLIETLDTTPTLRLPQTLGTRPAALPASTRSHPLSAGSPTIGAKRKRATEEHDARPHTRPAPAAEPQIVLRPAPKQPAKRRRVKDDAMCVKCQRTSYTEANVIIACGCGEVWHQLCHEPEISEETARNRPAFKCSTCIQEDKEQAAYQVELAKWRELKQEQAGLKKQQHEVAKMRERRLATLPEFIKPGLVGFEAGDASTNAVSCPCRGRTEQMLMGTREESTSAGSGERT